MRNVQLLEKSHPVWFLKANIKLLDIVSVEIKGQTCQRCTPGTGCPPLPQKWIQGTLTLLPCWTTDDTWFMETLFDEVFTIPSSIYSIVKSLNTCIAFYHIKRKQKEDLSKENLLCRYILQNGRYPAFCREPIQIRLKLFVQTMSPLSFECNMVVTRHGVTWMRSHNDPVLGSGMLDSVAEMLRNMWHWTHLQTTRALYEIPKKHIEKAYSILSRLHHEQMFELAETLQLFMV